jgi:hypothetical protein
MLECCGCVILLPHGVLLPYGIQDGITYVILLPHGIQCGIILSDHLRCIAFFVLSILRSLICRTLHLLKKPLCLFLSHHNLNSLIKDSATGSEHI